MYRKTDEAKNRMLYVRFPHSLHQRLIETSDQTGAPVAELVRRAVAAAYEARV